MNAARDLRVSIKGPLTTPVGGGIRSLNVTLRQVLDLYACVRPVKYFAGVPSPVKHPEKLDVVIFRENTEDVYAGIEWPPGHARGEEADRLPQQRHGRQEEDARRLRRRHQAHLALPAPSGWCACAIQYAIDNKRKSVTLVHKGNIMKFTEGAFREWGYEVAARRVPRPDRHRARKLDSRQPRSESQPDRRAECRADRAWTRVRLRRVPARSSTPRSSPSSTQSASRTATASGSRR